MQLNTCNTVPHSPSQPQVTCAEMQDILSHVLPPGTDTADERLVQLVSTAAAIARGLPSDLVSAIAAPSHNPLEEVEPEELAEYIRSLPTFSVVPLVGGLRRVQCIHA